MIEIINEPTELLPERSYPYGLEVSPKRLSGYDGEAQRKYRSNNREKYNVSQRELYYKLHQDAEWRAMFNERSKRNNLLSRQKKREDFLRSNPTAIIRGRGRPRKQNPTEEEVVPNPTEGSLETSILQPL
jgi:hypothetical protein